MVDLKAFFGEKRNLLWLLNCITLENCYYVVLMWTPFYFVKLGFTEESALISLMLPLMGCVSALLLNYLFTFCQAKIEILLVVFNGLTLLAEIVLLNLGTDQSQTQLYVVVVGAIGFCLAPSSARVIGFEVAILTEGNPALRTQVYFFESLARQIMIMVSLFAIGFLMEHNIRWLLYFILGNTVVYTLLHIVRKFWMTPREEASSETSLYEWVRPMRPSRHYLITL